MLASRVPYDRAAEVNNTQFLGEDACDKPQFDSNARWAEGVIILTRERKDLGPGNNISSYGRPDEKLKLKQLCALILKSNKPSVDSVGSRSPFPPRAVLAQRELHGEKPQHPSKHRAR